MAWSDETAFKTHLTALLVDNVMYSNLFTVGLGGKPTLNCSSVDH